MFILLKRIFYITLIEDMIEYNKASYTAEYAVFKMTFSILFKTKFTLVTGS